MATRANSLNYPCKFFKSHCHSKIFKLHCHSKFSLSNNCCSKITITELPLPIPNHTPLQIHEVNTTRSRDTMPKSHSSQGFQSSQKSRKQTQFGSNLASFLQGCCLINQKCYTGYYANQQNQCSFLPRKKYVQMNILGQQFSVRKMSTQLELEGKISSLHLH